MRHRLVLALFVIEVLISLTTQAQQKTSYPRWTPGVPDTAQEIRHMWKFAGPGTDGPGALLNQRMSPGLAVSEDGRQVFSSTISSGAQPVLQSAGGEQSACRNGATVAVSAGKTVFTACAGPQPFVFTDHALGTVVNAGPGDETPEAIAPVAPPLVMAQSDASLMYFGTCRVYESTDTAASWTAISPVLTQDKCELGDAFISVIAVAPSTVWVGTSDGLVYAGKQDVNGVWNWKNLMSAPSAGLRVTAIAVDPHAPESALVAYSGAFHARAGRLLRVNSDGTSSDAGRKLPAADINDVVADADMHGTFYLGTDSGVLATYDDGATWKRLGTDFTSNVIALRQNAATRALFAVTANQGVWRVGLGPTLVSTPSVVNFGARDFAASTRTVTIRNAGDETIHVASVTMGAAGSALQQSNTCGVLEPGTSCTVTVARTANTVAPDSELVVTTGNGAARSLAISVLGGVELPVTFAPVTFPDTYLGSTSAAQTITINNNSGGAVSISSVVAGGAAYVLNSTTCVGTLQNAASCTASVSFKPAVMFDNPGTLTVASSEAGSPFVMNVLGTGLGEDCRILGFRPISDWNEVVVNTVAIAVLAWNNLGNADDSGCIYTTEGEGIGRRTTEVDPPTSGLTNHKEVDFFPTHVGRYTATLKFSSTHPPALTDSLVVGGTAIAPKGEASVTLLDFGSQVINSFTSLPYTITNIGIGPMRTDGVSVTSGPFTSNGGCSLAVIAEGDSCSGLINFNPTAVGTFTGTMTLVSQAGIPPVSIALTGTATPAGMALSSTNLQFGAQLIGTSSAPQSVTLTNTTATTITIQSIDMSGDYLYSTTCSTLAAGASCDVQVTFHPTVTGTRNGSMTIVHNGPGSPAIVALSGTSTGPVVTLSTPSLTFQGQTVGTTSAAQSVTVTNTGNAALNISSIVASGDFALTTSGCATVAVNGTCTISIKFSPTASGTRSGTVSIAHDAANSPTQILLTGTGVASQAGAMLSPTSLTFSSQIIATESTTQAVTLTNNGTAALTISGITASGDFTETNNCGTSLAANANCTITVTFRPAAVGARTGTISVADNATGSPQTVTLSGSGADVVMTPPTGQTTTKTVPAGSSVSYMLDLASNGFSGTFTLLCSGAPSGSTCTVTPGQVTMTPNTTTPITVNIQTTARSAGVAGSKSMSQTQGLLIVLGVGLMVGMVRLRGGRQFMCVVLLLGCVAMTSCGGGGGGGGTPIVTGTPAGTYTIQVKAMSANGVKTADLTLTVN